MIRTSIDPVAVRTGLARVGRVQIPDYLEPAAAERLHGCLLDEVPWPLAFGDEDGPHGLSSLTWWLTIRRVTAQATAYRPGRFLRQHTEIDSSQGREYAPLCSTSVVAGGLIGVDCCSS